MIFAVAFCHMINDVMQYLLVVDLIRSSRTPTRLISAQIGLLSFTFQVTASMLQPVIGIYTDKRPLPYSLLVGMASSTLGLVVLGCANSYGHAAARLGADGLGSAIFHPRARAWRGSPPGGRCGFAQSTFQGGRNAGSATRPGARKVRGGAAVRAELDRDKIRN